MPTINEKTHIFEKAGYAYNFDRMMYLNRSEKKAFSLEFIQDHPEEELVKKIHESNDGNVWRFYFNYTPPDGIRRELERVLG